MNRKNHAHPTIWDSSPAIYVDLLPAWAWNATVYSIDGDTQVGIASSARPSGTDAVIWWGTPESVQILTPGGDYRGAEAHGAAFGQQVGFALYWPTGMFHAALWHGSAESFVDLHPSSGARWTQAFATDGQQQGGWADVLPGDGRHAALWSGTVVSFLDMHPAGATESVIRGMADGVQVGQALFVTQHHALVWHGTPESYIDLHPAGALDSEADATTGTIHAGWANFGGWGGAGVWFGDDPASFLSLHQYLGSEWFSSRAAAVSVFNGRIYVAGGGSRTGTAEALLWISPPLCPGDLDADGDVDVFDLSALLSHFGTASSAIYADGDVDEDGDVDLSDLTLLLSRFGATCP